MSKPLRPPAPSRMPISTVRELLRHVGRVGGSPHAIVERSGLPYRLEALLDPASQATLSREAVAWLYAECAWALDAHACRQEERLPITKKEVDLLCYCVITCATLQEVVARTTAFADMLIPRLGRLSLQIEGDTATFHMTSIRKKRNISAFVSDLTGLSMLHRLFGWLIGEDIDLLDVQVCYRPYLSEEVTAWLMPHTITYRAPDNLLRFPARYLQNPVVRSYAELAHLLERFPFDVEEPCSMHTPISERIRVVFGGALARQTPLPDGTVLAAQFGISPATLKRRLADEGTTLTRLKEITRRDLALRLLKDETLSATDIAGRLGFSDATAFRRAFKQWTGKSPMHGR